MSNKTCIIGGGASALMCACFAGEDVMIFENQDVVGKKILATGNGRCNLTNINVNDGAFNINVKKYLNQFNVDQTLQFFNSIGLEVYADEEGRVYPISNSATSVLAVLKNYIKLKKNIEINAKKCVKNVIFDKNKYKIEFDDETFCFFDKVVVASGNRTDLSIYDNMGIQSLNFLPSLCSLKTKQKQKRLAGVRVSNVVVKCDELKFEETGEVLFKEDALSGIVIFNLSSYMARAKKYNYKIKIDLASNIQIGELINKLIVRKQNLKEQKVEDFLTGFFHKEINLCVLKMANINTEKLVKDLTNSEIRQMCNIIKNLTFDSVSADNNNQVFSGGVLLEELDINLQSKKQKGLYFIGEVCNVDGVCGGYNLQWAWTSGAIVGKQI